LFPSKLYVSSSVLILGNSISLCNSLSYTISILVSFTSNISLIAYFNWPKSSFIVVNFDSFLSSNSLTTLFIIFEFVCILTFAFSLLIAISIANAVIAIFASDGQYSFSIVIPSILFLSSIVTNGFVSSLLSLFFKITSYSTSFLYIISSCFFSNICSMFLKFFMNRHALFSCLLIKTSLGIIFSSFFFTLNALLISSILLYIFFLLFTIILVTSWVCF